MVGHCIVTYRESAARFNFIVDDFEELRSPRSVDQRFPRVRSPSEMVVELVKHVGHMFLLMMKAPKGAPSLIHALYPAVNGWATEKVFYPAVIAGLKKSF